MAFLIFGLAHSFSHLPALFKLAHALAKRDETLLQAEFSANAEKAARVQPKTIGFNGISSGTQRAAVHVWHLREDNYDLKN